MGWDLKTHFKLQTYPSSVRRRLSGNTEIKTAKKKVYRSVLNEWPASQNLYKWKLLRKLFEGILLL